MPNDKEPPIRYACVYTPDCMREATTTVVINGHPKAVCEWCYRIEIRRQNTERERHARKEVSPTRKREEM